MKGMRNDPSDRPSLLSPAWRVPGTPTPPTGVPLPMSRQEMKTRGWDQCDIVIVSGDAYVDHPSFGAALIGRFLESLGYRVGIIAQPDTATVESFRILGPPRLFWGITAGNVDSHLAAYTVMRKKRHDDPYSPDGQADRRPVNASIVYTSLARQAYKGVPVILGGVEASLRRFPYYDYWTDKVRRSILFDAKADLVAFGMAERAVSEIAWRLRSGMNLAGICGTAEAAANVNLPAEERLNLPSFEEVSAPSDSGKAAFLEMIRTVFQQHRPGVARTLVQQHGTRWLMVHAPADPLTTEELDALYDLPFTRQPHPGYAPARIPAHAMIRDSITIHRGCYGGCSFCAISAHQGPSITSRSESNILGEIARLARTSGFHGTVSDLGGPTANMYGTGCAVGRVGCANRGCLHPEICRNLNTDHSALRKLMQSARRVPGVKHVFVSSGLRYDLALEGGGEDYIRELVDHHTCGLLKIAPEHVSSGVLLTMRKPPIGAYRRFVDAFRHAVTKAGKRYAVVEYFISGHPGCTLSDMVELACHLRRHGIEPEQVQDFYPAPLSLAAAMFYTGRDPLTGARVYVARTDREKMLQRALLLHHLPAWHRKAREALREAGREDLIGHGRECIVPPGP